MKSFQFLPAKISSIFLLYSGSDSSCEAEKLGKTIRIFLLFGAFYEHFLRHMKLNYWEVFLQSFYFTLFVLICFELRVCFFCSSPPFSFGGEQNLAIIKTYTVWSLEWENSLLKTFSVHLCSFSFWWNLFSSWEVLKFLENGMFGASRDACSIGEDEKCKEN